MSSGRKNWNLEKSTGQREKTFTPEVRGINVSVVLSNLGHKSKALGFVSGFTGEALEKMLDDFGCYTDFIQLDNGFTRINVKINAGEETEINGQGPRISEEAIGKLYEKLDALTKRRCT